MPLRFKAYVPDCDLTTDVAGIEWNGEGPKWITLMKGVPRLNYRNPYGSDLTKRVPAHRVKLIQVGDIDETDTK